MHLKFSIKLKFCFAIVYVPSLLSCSITCTFEMLHWISGVFVRQLSPTYFKKLTHTMPRFANGRIVFVKQLAVVENLTHIHTKVLAAFVAEIEIVLVSFSTHKALLNVIINIKYIICYKHFDTTPESSKALHVF